MTGAFHDIGILLWCLVTTVITAKVLPPENVSLDWRYDLYPELSWSPPRHTVYDCFYQINSTNRRQVGFKTFHEHESSPLFTYTEVNGGYLNISIETVCNGSMSEPVFVSLNDPDMHLSCLILSSSTTLCSWNPPSSADIHFYYSLEPATGNNSPVPPPLEECPDYKSRSSCVLQMNTNQQINVLLNGTAHNTTIRNIYQFNSVQVRLSPLIWTVKASKKHFYINWTQPEFPHLEWKYNIHYTFCGKDREEEVLRALWWTVDRMPECTYNISLRGFVEFGGETEWTHVLYDAIPSPNLQMLAAILSPLLMALIVILTLTCCMRNKKKIFPKVPEPNPELFKDLQNNNNNKIFISDLYLTKAEEECHVSLVVDQKLINSNHSTNGNCQIFA